MLVTAHYHHYWQVTQGGRLVEPDRHVDAKRIERQLFGCPAMDGGSQWWTDRTGIWSAPSVLTFVVDGYGVSDVTVLSPPADLVGAAAVRRTAA